MTPRERLLKLAAPKPPVTVTIAEWDNAEVRIRPLRALERAAFLDRISAIGKEGTASVKESLTAYAHLAIDAIVDEAGEAVFTILDFDDLVNLPSAGFFSLGPKILEMSGVSMGAGDGVDADREALEKN
jgi:hypothetical protein